MSRPSIVRVRGAVRGGLAALSLLALVLALGVGLAACGGGGGGGGGPGAGQDPSPRHPTYVSDRPGDCPICGMKIVPIEATGAPSGGSAAATASPGTADDDHAGHDPGVSATHAKVFVAPEAAQRAGVVVEAALRGRLARTVRTVGFVTPDESRIRQAEARAGGWVRFLHVGATGRFVSVGEPLLILESPEQLAAQQEYAAAWRSRQRLGEAAPAEVRENLDAVLTASRSRLELLGVPKAMLADLERSGQPQPLVPVLAPASGYVTTKDVYEGRRVEPGMILFTIADLSRIWIEARVFESEIGGVSVGQAARLSLPFDPDFTAGATVTQVVPEVDAATRTLTVRLSVANPDTRLKPGMYADVTFDLESHEGILVSESAVLETGLRRIVFVKTADNHYEPRAVTVALKADGQALLTSGVSAGEAVVTGAAFLIDSESRIRAAVGRATTTGHGAHGDGE
jgi:Cu(I)/Ag(I) efflux system membrane fusion protein